MSSWTTVSLVPSLRIEDQIQSSPGVYVIFGDGLLVYIGSSRDVGARLRSHLVATGSGEGFKTKWGLFKDTKIKIRPSKKYGDWLMYEARLLRRLDTENKKALEIMRRDRMASNLSRRERIASSKRMYALGKTQRGRFQGSSL